MSGMGRREFVALLGGAALAAPVMARAQQGERVHRIGWLTAQREASLTPFLAALRTAFVDLGYDEGRNLAIEYRFGDDNIERVPELAAELVRLPVEIVLAQGAAVAVIAKLRLPVPVVYVFSGDPVSAGFADSLARPRGNMTGLTFMAADLNGKRLELLRETIPGLRRVAIVANPAHPGEHLERAYTQDYGRQLGLNIDYFATTTRDELHRAFTSMAKDPQQAISLFADGFAIEHRQSIIDFGLNQSSPGRVRLAGFRQKRCNVHVWPPLGLVLSAVSILCRPYLQGRSDDRSSDRATDQVRVCRQFAHRKSAWHRGAHVDPSPRRRGN
jgi:putative ABC transport system substrate-binding protein